MPRADQAAFSDVRVSHEPFACTEKQTHGINHGALTRHRSVNLVSAGRRLGGTDPQPVFVGVIPPIVPWASSLPSRATFAGSWSLWMRNRWACGAPASTMARPSFISTLAVVDVPSGRCSVKAVAVKRIDVPRHQSPPGHGPPTRCASQPSGTRLAGRSCSTTAAGIVVIDAACWLPHAFKPSWPAWPTGTR